MRCNICDVVINEPVFNSDLNQYEPCEYCLSIIMDAAKDSADKPYADEDDFSDEAIDRLVSTYLPDPDDDFSPDSEYFA